MANLKYKTRGNSNPQGKPRVYFCCHPENFNKCFETVSNEILTKQNCAIWYAGEEVVRDEDFFADLKQMQLFVMPVTTNLLCTDNEALDSDFKFAIENHIPVLPLMQESGLEELFNKKCGDLQFLDKNNTDVTAISYDEKLKKYLESVLIGDELAEKIRAAFDAYVFLSYRKKDRRYAQELMRLIHKNEFCRDIAIWYDEFLTPGENFNDSIKEALQKSGLFVLAVTPNLVNEPNYIMTTEYPMAKQEGKPILPAELVPTDREQLSEKYEDIPNPADAYNEAELSEALLESIKKMAIKENDNSPEHNFFIGLAYLGGVDVEVDRERALELIIGAANNELPEAMVKLISMYSDGVGVSRDQSEAKKWSEKLAEYYFKNIFSEKGSIKSKKKILELFSNYKNQYWFETIKYFLINADKSLSFDMLRSLYKILLSLGICEYTLLFDTCKELTQYQEATQIILIKDILTKSVDGTYPPYGPLFWYIPEYELYEILLLTLDALQNHSDFAKMVALVRDVCWIFGQRNTIREITNRVDGDRIYKKVSECLCSVRKALCELFCIGTTDYEYGKDIYPRCFNVAEAESFINNGCGLYDRMTVPFEDELELYCHNNFNILDNEHIGFLALPYDIDHIEGLLNKRTCKKIRGLSLSPTEHLKMEYISANTRNVEIIYIPENIKYFNSDWYENTKIKQWCFINNKIAYYTTHFTVNEDVTVLHSCQFLGSSSLKSVSLPTELCTIGERAFENCANLLQISIPNSVTELGKRAFNGCSSLQEVCCSNHLISTHEGAFSNCKSLYKINLPETLKEIGAGTFENCKSLKHITIPESVSKIGMWAFAGSALENVVLPDDLECIESRTFSCCGLKSIHLPKRLRVISSGAFEGCKWLLKIVIPDDVVEIKDMAFQMCSNLLSASLPRNLRSLGKCVFNDCPSLLTIVNVPQSCTRNMLGIDKEVGIEFKQQAGIFIFDPQEVNTYKNESLVIVPRGIIKIEEKDFGSFDKVEEVELPSGLRFIENFAFSKCQNLRKINLPDSVEHIGFFAFEGTNLSKIHIPPKVKIISSFAFFGCRMLETVVFSDGNETIGDSSFLTCENLLKIEFPVSISLIGNSSFKGCKSVKELILPITIKKIGDDAFRDCCSLTSVVISRRFENDIFRIFGEVDPNIFTFV